MDKTNYATIDLPLEVGLLKRLDHAVEVVREQEPLRANLSRGTLVSDILERWLDEKGIEAPAEKKDPTPWQQRVGAILELWEGFPPEVERPKPALVAKWIKQWPDDKQLANAIVAFRGDRYFEKGPRYVHSCLQTALLNRGHPAGQQRPAAPPLDFEDWR